MNDTILLILLLTLSPLSYSKIPVIAVFSAPTPPYIRPVKHARISNNYVQWITASGGRVIGIHMWQSDEEIFEILEQVNGLIIQGGVEDIHDKNDFILKIMRIFDKVVQMNDNGKVFPVMGSCLGFEIILTYFADYLVDTSHLFPYVFEPINVGPVVSTISIESDDITKYQMFKFFSKQDLEDISTKKISTKYHHNGMIFDTFYKSPSLVNSLDITTSSKDKDGVKYITSVEGKKYPFYGMHFHMEKTVYHILSEPVAGSVEAITCARNFGNAFIDKATQNPNNLTLEEVQQNFDFIDPAISKPTINPIGLIYVFDNPHSKNITLIDLE